MRRWLFAALALAALPLVARPAPADDKDEDKKPEAKPKVVVFKLHESLPEISREDSLFGRNKLSFRELVSRMKRAAEDDAVKAVVLLSEESSLGSAQREEIRQVMAKLRDAKKDIYAHSDSLAMGDYVLFSGASRISAVPTADLWITGIYGEAPYVRGLLNKLGVKPDFLHCGAYKSASEIFMRDGPSPEAESMQNWLLDSLFSSYIDLIAKGRSVDADKVKGWIDNGPYTAEKAKTAGLIDAVETREEFTSFLKSKYGDNLTFVHKYGDKKSADIDLSSPFAFLKVWGDMMKEAKSKKGGGKDAIAIVYVDGAISLGSTEPSPFGGLEGAKSTDIRKALDEAARDKSVKAVVLRVDSPGGSAVASEIILDATRRVKEKKPFIEIALHDLRPQKLIVLSRDELKQHEMRVHGYDHPSLRYFIGDVRDRDRLYRAFDGVDVVVHAAALKQVPAAEYNPLEAIKTNIWGAANVIDAAIDRNVKQVVALSTDKAANPINLYGATKLCSDKLFVAANSYSGRHVTRFSVVRYGNVVGSRGSVVPFFLNMRATGKLPITDPRMTRFWITLEQGVDFVLRSLQRMEGGEIFVPKIPSMRIIDLARAIAPECAHQTVGIRPGEKLHEIMISEDDARQSLEYDDHYVILPSYLGIERSAYIRRNGGRPCADGFRYSSDGNDRWLSEAELKNMMGETTIEIEDARSKP